MFVSKQTNAKPFGRFAIFVLLILAATSSAAAQRVERKIDSWRPLHYDIALTFDDQMSQLSAASAKITIEVLAPSLDKVDFDFGEMPVDSVFVSGRAAIFDHTPETLKVTLPVSARRGNKIEITVNYHGHPKDGLVFAKDRDGNPSATGDNWPNRVHYWIPSFDHPSAKATVSFTISAPQRYQVVANGKFISLTGNAATSHWQYDEAKAIPAYCMVVAVNQGAVINTPFQAVPLIYNVAQRDKEYAPKGFSPAAPALTFFSQTIAPYPYEKLALIIAATRFGGMENSSAIVFAANLFDRQQVELNAPGANNRAITTQFAIPSRIETVVAHEIAHQWFGDSVTESTWADLWLSEGFATYFAGLFMEKYEGEDAFHTYMRDAAQRYFTFEKRASFPIHDTETTNLMGLLNENNYDKGAWVLHMLRSQLGDEVFFKGLRNYYNAHKEANATSDDLRAALEKSSGKDLKAFFARWIYGSGHPRYQPTWNAADPRDASKINLRLDQIQAGEPFLDPVPIEFVVNGKPELKTIIPTGKSTSTPIKLSGPPTKVTLDPNETLLREVSYR
ncbi:MAG TPA: M1 family metallopeptidase [Pyrinomonadaceae bacterium]|nr:M1 family metallopeptidase [Pyrinomonadaceae bacterium]